jgi:hypothetical protein
MGAKANSVTPLPTAGPTPAERRRLVDEFGALETKLTALRPDIRRHEQLGKIIRGWYADLPANQAFSCKGEKFVVVAGPREFQRVIRSMLDLFKLIGQKRFLEFCSLPLKVLESNATAAEMAKLVDTRQIGPRALQVAALDAA